MNELWLWLEDNQGLIVAYALRFIVGLAILIGGFILSGILSRQIIKRLDKTKIDNAVVSFLAGIVRAIVVAAAIMMALSHVGIQTTSFIAILGAMGLAVGLSLQGSLANFASGVLIMIYRPFKAGDYVDAGGIAGTVIGIELFTTVLKTPDSKKVVVPNSRITSSPITNFSEHPTRRVDMVIGVSYNSDLRKAKEVLMRVLKEDERVLEEPAPRVSVTELADSSVNFIVRPWVKSEDYWPFYWDTMEKIKLTLDEEGIGIPFPQMDVHLHQAGSDEGPIRIASTVTQAVADKSTDSAQADKQHGNHG
ncbi:mechanosensitive ion channel family protein [Aliidiomarina maris]|uniref:Small-conductance mechanosensitive channel n=1 Tax=Aliidiomarina maris TaxID=531312 RepID=A0A327X2Q9_9GAMM|nr:mechanosensitive ion channel domain-containing protein [Aliidiomarina maris]RAK00688.1 small conductance mechanosensitive channel [Aliidiomarina maris]RUO27308.1 mechanosensitive ion channel protein [Aliidiomarina maris]